MGLYRSRIPFSRVVETLFQIYVSVWVRPKVTGREHLPKEGAFIIASNHTSHADTAVIFNALPRAIRRRTSAAAAQDYFFNGDFRTVASRMLFNAIPLSREIHRGQDPLRHVVRALREGYGVLLFPEGTRSKDGKIGPFRSGIGRLIAEFPDLPIIPTYVGGTHRVMPKGKLVPRPFSVTVTFGEPLYLKARLHQRSTWQIVADHVRRAVIILSGEEPPPPPPPLPADPQADAPADQPLRESRFTRLRRQISARTQQTTERPATPLPEPAAEEPQETSPTEAQPPEEAEP